MASLFSLILYSLWIIFWNILIILIINQQILQSLRTMYFLVFHPHNPPRGASCPVHILQKRKARLKGLEWLDPSGAGLPFCGQLCGSQSAYLPSTRKPVWVLKIREWSDLIFGWYSASRKLQKHFRTMTKSWYQGIQNCEEKWPVPSQSAC